jgi:hypothetical protein
LNKKGKLLSSPAQVWERRKQHDYVKLNEFSE